MIYQHFQGFKPFYRENGYPLQLEITCLWQRVSGLQSHVVQCHPVTSQDESEADQSFIKHSDQSYECKKCGKFFQSGAAIGGHMTSHRADKVMYP